MNEDTVTWPTRFLTDKEQEKVDEITGATDYISNEMRRHVIASLSGWIEDNPEDPAYVTAEYPPEHEEEGKT